MEGDSEDEDDLFDLGEDWEEGEEESRTKSGTAEGPVHGGDAPYDGSHTEAIHQSMPEELSMREEGAMAHDPYNSSEWDILMAGDGDTEQQRLGDACDDGDGDGEGYDDEDEINSLLDAGLEEVDDILRKKGRLNALEPTRNADATEHGTPVVGNSVRGEGQAGGLHHDAIPEAQPPTARGTGAQAASVLNKAGIDPVSTGRRMPPGMAPPTSLDAPNDESTSGGIHKAPAHAVYSPTRRKARDPPFIQAKGLSLTYAQAKLFGLGGYDSPSGVSRDSSLLALQKVLKASTRPAVVTWPGSRVNTSSSRRSFPAHPQQRDRPNITYSKSRMEQLARPVPGKGSIDTDGTGDFQARSRAKGEELSFTWKRSRKAEAAMRDPACGYDFVREIDGYGDKNGFLGRVEAYSTYSRAKLEATRAEAEYAALLDKLECPQCGNPQSYDEFSSKKLICPGCDVAYHLPRTWNRRVWDQRNAMRAAKSEERQERMAQEAEETFLRGWPRQSRYGALLRQRAGQVGFMCRMRRDLRKRRAREVTCKTSERRAEVLAPATTPQPRRPASAPVATDASRRIGKHVTFSRRAVVASETCVKAAPVHLIKTALEV